MATVIDAHHHVWDLSVRDQPWLAADGLGPIRRTFSVDDLRSHALAAGVTATVLVQTVTVADETPEMLALAASDDLVASVVGWTELTSPAITETLARLADGTGGTHLAGMRHQVQDEPDPDWLRRPDVIRGLQAIADAGLVYDLVIRPHQLAAATYAAGAVPGGTFVLDHAGKPPIADGPIEPWSAALRAFAARPNTVCKLSGLFTEGRIVAPYADVVLDAFGADRVMFGSDWPVSLLAFGYAEVVAGTRALVSGLGRDEKAAVFGGTAARVYGIRE